MTNKKPAPKKTKISRPSLYTESLTARRTLQLRQMPPEETALDDAEVELEALLGELSADDLADARAMFPEDLDALFVCEPKGVPTETTYELTLVFKPSQVFLDLLAALRAREHDRDVVNVCLA